MVVRRELDAMVPPIWWVVPHAATRVRTRAGLTLTTSPQTSSPPSL
jgi:hypothetical protein